MEKVTVHRINSDFKSALHLCSFCFLNFPRHLVSGEMETRTSTFPLLPRVVRSQDFSFTGLSWVMVPFADMGSQKKEKVLREKKTSLILGVIVFIIQL